MFNVEMILQSLIHARRFSMPRFLNHEPLASDLFNLHHCTGTGTLQSWGKCLTNTEELLILLTQRLEQDWSSLAVKMRRPWGVKDVDTKLIQNISVWEILSTLSEKHHFESHSPRAIPQGNLATSLRSFPGGRGAVCVPGSQGLRWQVFARNQEGVSRLVFSSYSFFYMFITP